MIKTKNIAILEKDGVLFQKNFGFISENTDQNEINNLVSRAKKFLLGILSQSEVSESAEINEQLKSFPGKENCNRILFADAERTFSLPQHQESLMKITHLLYKRLGDYQQNISFISSFLMLFLDPAEVVLVVQKIAKEERYLKGHFESASIGAKVDPILFRNLSEAEESTRYLSELVRDRGVPVDYLKKWFSGLCVHLLPFKALFDYFEIFSKEGFKGCLKFGLASFKVLGEIVPDTADIEELMEFLEFKLKALSSRGKSLETLSERIVKIASETEWPILDDFNIESERLSIFENEVKPAMERADKFAEQNPEESIPLCEICKDGFRDLYCSDCKIYICEECHESPPKSLHSNVHKCEEVEDSDDIDSYN